MGILTFLMGAAAIVPAVCFILLVFAFKAISGKGKRAVLAAADASVMIFFFSVYIKIMTLWNPLPSIYLFWSAAAWTGVFVLFYWKTRWKRPRAAFKKMWRLSFMAYFAASSVLFLYGAFLSIAKEFS
ncbi:DUF3397 family protein [Bacillus mangrovi]|uniref:DUF3397 family protein n=1 Tax=Metabacillus mangrovi TaxID=1491830 RepID=A0A7X2S3C4_9BACI|nr:DUF3397 family protein [Metabacillus mangrovi]MTH52627.1 DUF3397 family protein [Metabacillus mangrovi]